MPRLTRAGSRLAATGLTGGSRGRWRVSLGSLAWVRVEAADEDVLAAIREVADEVHALATGYGETAYDPKTKTVLYVTGDWTDPDPIAEAFLAVDGVEHFEYEAEGMPSGWCDATPVWPEPMSKWLDCTESKAAHDPGLAELLALAREPLAIEE